MIPVERNCVVDQVQFTTDDRERWTCSDNCQRALEEKARTRSAELAEEENPRHSAEGDFEGPSDAEQAREALAAIAGVPESQSIETEFLIAAGAMCTLAAELKNPIVRVTLAATAAGLLERALTRDDQGGDGRDGDRD